MKAQNVRTGHNGLYAGIFAFATAAVGFFGVDTVYIFQYQPVGTCAGRSTQADFAIGAKTDTQPSDVGSCEVFREVCSLAFVGEEEVAQPVDIHCTAWSAQFFQQ